MSTPRILVGSCAHESNTFNPLTVGLAEFSPRYGSEAIVEPGRGSLGGIVSVLADRGYELIPTIAAHAMPGGRVRNDAFEAMRRSFVGAAGSGVDGVCLFLHGAMRTESEDYADAALVKAVRDTVGPGVPIVVAMDLHGNITESLVHNADALVAYRTAPHVDTFATGEKAARYLDTILTRSIRPVMGFVRVPMLMPGEMAQTDREPMVSLLRMADEIEASAKMLSVSITKSHCWADVPKLGMGVVVVAEEDEAMAQARATDLAREIWRRRHEFRATVETYGVEESIRVALNAPERTVYLSDSGDNPGAGGTTDVPAMVKALLDQGVPSALVAAVWDVESTDACIAAGLGSSVDLSIGGKIDLAHGAPLPVRATVERMGLDYAVARIGEVDVLLSRHRMSIVNPEQLRSRSIEPEHYRMVVLKRGYLEPAFQAIAQRSILSLSPGCTNCDVRRLSYERLERPIYPLDASMSWEPEKTGG